MVVSTSMIEINASDFVGTGFPTDEGKNFAIKILESQKSLDRISVDVSGCAPALLISAFFNAFLQHIFEESEENLDMARTIEWNTLFPFQIANIARWVSDFKPHVS